MVAGFIFILLGALSSKIRREALLLLPRGRMPSASSLCSPSHRCSSRPAHRRTVTRFRKNQLLGWWSEPSSVEGVHQTLGRQPRLFKYSAEAPLKDLHLSSSPSVLREPRAERPKSDEAQDPIPSISKINVPRNVVSRFLINIPRSTASSDAGTTTATMTTGSAGTAGSGGPSTMSEAAGGCGGEAGRTADGCGSSGTAYGSSFRATLVGCPSRP